MVVTILRGCTVPGEPRKVRVEVINSTAVKVVWRPPSDRQQNGIVRGYRVHYAQLGDHEEPLVNVPPARVDLPDGRSTDVVVAALQPDTLYQFEVQATTRKGHGELSRPRKVRTKGAGTETHASCRYLPSDWLERLLRGSLIVARGSPLQSPGRRVFIVVLV